jgi:hypothetical protein|tara:strand:+ start:408 stop:761 length:354 start_codon:yes stop_codon:yes gene_type:complete
MSDNIYKTILSFSDFGNAILGMEYSDIPKYVFDFAESKEDKGRIQELVKQLIEIKRWESQQKDKIIQLKLANDNDIEQTSDNLDAHNKFLKGCDVLINDCWNEIAKLLKNEVGFPTA